MGLFGPRRPYRLPTPMLVAKGEGLDLETVLSLMRTLDRTLMIEAYRDRLVQESMNELGLRLREGTDPARSRFHLSVMNEGGGGEFDDGEERDTLVKVSTRRQRLIVRVVGRTSPFRTDANRRRHLRCHPMFDDMIDHGLAILHWADDAVRACLRKDLPDPRDLVSTAVVCGLEQRCERSLGGALTMRRCTMATPLHASRTLSVQRTRQGERIRTLSSHPLIEAAVPASIVSYAAGEIRLLPVVGTIEGMTDDPMAIMRHYDAALRITALARKGGLLK